MPSIAVSDTDPMVALGEEGQHSAESRRNFFGLFFKVAMLLCHFFDARTKNLYG